MDITDYILKRIQEGASPRDVASEIIAGKHEQEEIEMSDTKTAGVALDAAKAAVMAAEVVRSGEKLTLPTGMGIPRAIELLKARADYEQQEVAVSAAINCFPHDGAVALHRTLTRIYGWAQAVPTPGFFGPKPPQMLTIETGPRTTIQVPWGRFELPNIQGWISTGYSTNRDGMVIFNLQAMVKRESELTVEKLFAEVRQEALTHSIYRGKAIKMRFLDSDGDRLELPQPEFMDVDAIDDSLLVYPDSVEQAIETNLFTPIRRVHDCLNNGIPLKRGVLLGGTYGTGKTLAASVAAKLAVQHGVTYLYIPRADELSHALAFARQYQSPACVVFCEDIDRVTAGDRSVEMDDILNIIDGIDSKTANIIVVLTTNEMEKINPAMLRPGRLDAVINVLPPDAKAAARLLRLYGRGVIAENTDLTRAGELLAGKIPAIIAEVVKRTKLAQLKYTPEGSRISEVSEQAVVDAAETMRAQMDLLERLTAPKMEVQDTLGDALVRTIGSAQNEGRIQ